MLSDKIIELLDVQINKELHSAYQYLAMANYCASIGFDGAAHWMKKQAGEEVGHASKIIGYMEDRQVRPTLKSISQPKLDFSGLRDVFEGAVLSEKSVTQSIDNIAGVALAESDHATYAFLQWFVTEQVEEEKEAQRLADKVKSLETHIGLLFALDKELARRE